MERLRGLIAGVVLGFVLGGGQLPAMPAFDWLSFGQSAPFKTDTLSVAIFHESGDLVNESKISREQANVMQASADGTFRGELTKRKANFRLLDQDDDLTKEPQWVQDAHAAWVKASKPIPGLVLSTGRKGYVGALPKTMAEALMLSKKYGGA